MPAVQFMFGLFAEGRSDDRFFPTLFERYFSYFSRLHGIDAEFMVVPLPDVQRKGLFETLSILEKTFFPAYFLFHRDADFRDESRVVERIWSPWLEQAKEPERWIPVIPVRMMEAWQLCDPAALARVFRVDQVQVQELMNTANPEKEGDPKSVIDRLRQRSPRRIISEHEELLAKRISLSALQSLPSFRAFERRLSDLFAHMMS